jgi:hypothetical protein
VTGHSAVRAAGDAVVEERLGSGQVDGPYPHD